MKEERDGTVNNELKVGDCVNPVTGGCLMTVRTITGEDVRCDWFDDHQQLQSGAFKVSKLRPWLTAVAKE